MFVCERCGLCCSNAIGLWEKAKLSKREIVELKKELEKYPTDRPMHCCEMLYFEESGLAGCMIHTLFGKDRKPIVDCRDWPIEPATCSRQDKVAMLGFDIECRSVTRPGTAFTELMIYEKGKIEIASGVRA